MGLEKTLKLILDKGASAQLVADFRAAGAQSSAALKQELLKKQGDLRHDLAAGLISKEEFAKKGAEAAQAYNAAVIERIKTLQTQGKLTSDEYIKLTKSLQLAGKVGGEQAGLLSKAWSGFKNLITSFAPAIAAAFTVRAVVNFAKDSIKAANDADHAWRDLGASVRNVGGDYEALRPRIEATLEAIGDRDVFDPDELAAGMARMVDMTKDTALSLEAMGAAADLARAKGIPLQQAVDLIGRALETGNTRGLVPFVGKLKEGEPVLAQIHKALGNVTERMTPFERSTGLLNIAWDNFKEAIGGALIEAGQGGSILEKVTGVVRAMTKWVIENKSEIAAWAGGIVTAIKLTLIPIFAQLRWDFALVKAAWYGLVAAFQGSMVVFDMIKLGVVEFAKTISGALIPAMNAMARAAEFLGMDQVAAQLRSAAANMTKDYNALSLSAATTARDMKRHNEASTEAGKKMAASLVDGAKAARDGMVKTVAAIKEIGTGSKDTATVVATTTAAMGGSVAGATDRMAGAHAKATKEIVGVWRAAWGESLKDTKDFTDQIDDYLQRANAKQVEESTEFLHRLAGIRDESIEQSLQREIYANQKILNDTKATAAEKRKAFERLAAIQEEQTGRATVAALTSGKTIRDDATETAKSSSTSWIDATNLMVNALQGLGKSAGGIFGGILNSISGIAQGAGALGGAIKSIQNAGGGIAGTIGKVAGVAGVAGAAISIGSTIISAIGGLFHRDKNPGRLKANKEAFIRAVQNTDQSAMDFLFQKSPANVGGGGGWATRLAQEDAYEAYMKALQLNPNLQPATADLGTPHRTMAPSLNVQSIGGATTALAGFALGGAVKRTGPAFLHAGEVVFSPVATARLGGQEQLAAMNAALQNGGLGGRRDDHSVMNVGPIILNGVADRDVPRRVVDEISLRLGQNYQKHSALQGNVALPEG